MIGEDVFFFYRGNARQVEWLGVFNGWQAPGLSGIQLGQTDLWMAQTSFPEDSRVEYKLLLDGANWILDPANPNIEMSGLTFENSVLLMPGFAASYESIPRSDVEIGFISEEISIYSENLDYFVNYLVYLPVGYDSLNSLPVLYVLDGNDFTQESMGALPIVLDNMIADGRIQPLIVVFVDARDPENTLINRREKEFLVTPLEFSQFISEELVPAIDQNYQTDPSPDARTIMGSSLGGLSVIYIASTNFDVFHNVATFSPSLWVLDSPEYLSDPSYIEGSKIILEPVEAATVCGGETGINCPRYPLNVFITAGVPAWDVGDLSKLVETLKNQHYSVEFHQVNEGHTWSQWRGLSDEMLIYFFGVK